MPVLALPNLIAFTFLGIRLPEGTESWFASIVTLLVAVVTLIAAIGTLIVALVGARLSKQTLNLQAAADRRERVADQTRQVERERFAREKRARTAAFNDVMVDRTRTSDYQHDFVYKDLPRARFKPIPDDPLGERWALQNLGTVPAYEVQLFDASYGVTGVFGTKIDEYDVVQMNHITNAIQFPWAADEPGRLIRATWQESNARWASSPWAQETTVFGMRDREQYIYLPNPLDHS